MKRMPGFLPIALLLFACAPAAPPPPTQVQVTPVAAPGFPPTLRWGLTQRWIDWNNGKATPVWPPNHGCAAAPRVETLAPGKTIDRFGDDNGSFFSPRGEAYATRAVPYVCRQMDYTVYRVAKPIAVQTCAAAPWFGEPGGATQYRTAEPAARLVAAGQLEVVSHASGGSTGPAPQCGRP